MRRRQVKSVACANANDRSTQLSRFQAESTTRDDPHVCGIILESVGTGELRKTNLSEISLVAVQSTKL